MLRFQVRTQTEDSIDYFVVRVSYDGGMSSQEVYRLSGYNEWSDITVPLQQGGGEVVLLFDLQSDGSIVDQGIWLDNVEIMDGSR